MLTTWQTFRALAGSNEKIKIYTLLHKNICFIPTVSAILKAERAADDSMPEKLVQRIAGTGKMNTERKKYENRCDEDS